MDDIQRMITLFSDIAAKVLGKELPSQRKLIISEIYDSVDLYEALFYFLENGEICKAENLLFDTLEEKYSNAMYLVGEEFYSALGNLDEGYLQSHNFSKAEIVQGMEDLKKIKKEE